MDCAALGAGIGFRGACFCAGATGAVFEVVSVLHPKKNADINVTPKQSKCVVFMSTV